MENVRGTSLLSFFNDCAKAHRRLDDRFFRLICNKIAMALHKLHSAKVAHRDIKIENIMITHDFRVKLVDFGFGIPLSGRDGSSFMKSRKGTRMYRAPEIVKGDDY